MTTTKTPADMTPVEIDTQLAELHRQAGSADQQIMAEMATLHYMLGERKIWRSRNRAEWPTTDDAALAAARARRDEYNRSYGRTLGAGVDAYDAAVAARAAIDAAAAPFNAEYAARRWSRFFVVQQHNGHIHSDMNCSTCNRGAYRTQFGWNPELSGLTEAEAVEKLGPALCTVCFPTAPVEWTIGRNDDDTTCGGGQPVRPVEGTARRYARSTYAECPNCHERFPVKADGTLRKHKKPAAK